MNLLLANLLTALILLPLVGAVLVALAPRTWARPIAVTLAVLTFGLSLLLLPGWSSGLMEHAGYRFEVNVPWLSNLGVSYHVGVDGLSLWLLLLTTFLTPLVILASWTDIKSRVRAFVICLLLLESALVGVFVALDVVLFYIFWEVVLIPMYLLIGVWGGPRRIYAAIKFFLFTMAGSVLMLAAILYLYLAQPAGTRTFDLPAFLATARQVDATQPGIALWLFAAFTLAFAIKVPLFPLHTWLPDAHTEAPTAGSVMLAAVLLKMGTYGFLRFSIPCFPAAADQAAPLMVSLALIGIVYGALVAMMQTDIKKLVAYSSVSHLGFVVLGIFAALSAGPLGPLAITGASLQMVNHGISTGALFLLVGVLYERRHTREVTAFGGIAQVMPRYTILFWLALFSSIGLPGLNGFVGEYLILQGTVAANFWYAAAAATGVILGAVYMLRMFRAVMFGELTQDANRNLRDVNLREQFVLGITLAVAVLIGVVPGHFLRFIEPDAARVLQSEPHRPRVDTTHPPLNGRPAAR